MYYGKYSRKHIAVYLMWFLCDWLLLVLWMQNS